MPNLTDAEIEGILARANRDLGDDDFCLKCEDRLMELKQLCRELQAARLALREIAEYQPEWDASTVDIAACSGCARARERSWPPSGLCAEHYRAVAAIDERNERARHSQYLDMKRIARAALGEPAERPE